MLYEIKNLLKSTDGTTASWFWFLQFKSDKLSTEDKQRQGLSKTWPMKKLSNALWKIFLSHDRKWFNCKLLERGFIQQISSRRWTHGFHICDNNKNRRLTNTNSFPARNAIGFLLIVLRRKIGDEIISDIMNKKYTAKIISSDFLLLPSFWCKSNSTRFSWCNRDEDNSLIPLKF